MTDSAGEVMVLGALSSLAEHVANISAVTSSSLDLAELPGPPDAVPASAPATASSVVPVVELVLGTITYLVIIAMTVVGNTLVVVAVFSYRPLKKVQNYLLVSLAASDLAVAIFVMPLHVVKFLADGRWLLGVYVCQFFTTADILLCTSSILNLCAIAIDRYWAIHDPLNYAQKRTPKFVCGVIVLVWILSAMISVPPLIGWNDWSSQKLRDHCELTTEKAFVVFSASGSFFLPLLVMVVVYVKIFISARQRIRTNRGRSALMRINNPPPEGVAGTEIPAETHKRLSKRASEPAPRNGAKVSGGGGAASERVPLVEAEAVSAQHVRTTERVERNSIRRKEEEKSSSNDTPDELTKNMKYAKGTATATSVTLKKSANPENENELLQNPTNALRKREKISVAKEKRAAKTIAVIIFVFSFCWLPFFCAYVIMPFCSSCSLHPKVMQAFTWLGYINSSLNPFLYGILNLEFRRAFKKILCPKSVLAQRRRMSGH